MKEHIFNFWFLSMKHKQLFFFSLKRWNLTHLLPINNSHFSTLSAKSTTRKSIRMFKWFKQTTKISSYYYLWKSKWLPFKLDTQLLWLEIKLKSLFNNDLQNEIIIHLFCITQHLVSLNPYLCKFQLDRFPKMKREQYVRHLNFKDKRWIW